MSVPRPALSARDVAAIARRPLRTIQRWARHDSWRSHRDGRRVLYDVDDAMAGVARRAERREA